MSVITVCGIFMAAWVMLSVMLGERQWRLDFIRYEIATRPPPSPQKAEDAADVKAGAKPADPKKPDPKMPVANKADPKRPDPPKAAKVAAPQAKPAAKTAAK